MAPLILLALLAFADRPPIDAVVLIEESPRTRIQRIEIRFTEGDRMAIMTFNSRTHLKLRFTDNPAQIARAIHAPWLGVSMFSTKADPHIHVLDAIAKANALFSETPAPERRRAVILLFSSEDENSKSNIDQLHAALVKTGTKLALAAIDGETPISDDEKLSQAPVPRPGPPQIRVTRYPIPDRTMELLRPLTTYTQRNSWNLDKLLDSIRQ